jgi:hypothetical protein
MPPGLGGDGENHAGGEAAEDFGDEPRAAAEGGADGGFEGIFHTFAFEQLDDPGGEEGTADGPEDVIGAEHGDGEGGDADEAAEHGSDDGGPTGGAGGAEGFGADETAEELDGFGQEEDEENDEEEGPVGLLSAVVVGQCGGSEEDEPIAGEAGDVKGDGGEGDEEGEEIEDGWHRGIVTWGRGCWVSAPVVRACARGWQSHPPSRVINNW